MLRKELQVIDDTLYFEGHIVGTITEPEGTSLRGRLEERLGICWRARPADEEW